MVGGAAVAAEVVVPVAALRSMPRTRVVAALHCVAGWSATGLVWEGVSLRTFSREVVRPALAPDAVVTHLVTQGRDGYRCPVLLDDVLAADVLLADTLDGAPLDGDTGAPLRYVSPGQHGFVSTKHLARIEVRTDAPPGRAGGVPLPPAADRGAGRPSRRPGR